MRGHKTKQLEKRFGSLELIIPKLVNEHGQVEAAKYLSVSQGFIHYWLRRHGYVRVTRWVRENENA